MSSDMHETKRFVRCELCGLLVEESEAIDWRMYSVRDGYPLWACPEEFRRDAAGTLARLRELEAEQLRRMKPINLNELLGLSGD